MDCDYYDGAQISAEVMQRLKNASIPQQDSNLIKPTVNAVLGLEARSRTDYRITSDDQPDSNSASALRQNQGGSVHRTSPAPVTSSPSRYRCGAPRAPGTGI